MFSKILEYIKFIVYIIVYWGFFLTKQKNETILKNQ